MRASPFRRCCRTWVRHQNRIVRLLMVSDYRSCANGGEPRTFVKRITHRRWPRGWHAFGTTPSWAAVYASLPANKWCEVVVKEAA
ncbi:MAG: hypothetical protein ACOYM3_15660 [Terrimicrobiaceae bacterium]